MSKRPGDPGYAAGWCVHYGFDRKQSKSICEAGLDPERFRTSGQWVRQEGGPSLMDVQPCFLTDAGESKPGALPCECLRRPTPREIAEHNDWQNGRVERLGKVMEFIAPWRKRHKGKSAAEVVGCPICHGRLHIQIAAYNGHVRGKCATPGCVEWVE
jgi:hypothetical protein